MAVTASTKDAVIKARKRVAEAVGQRKQTKAGTPERKAWDGRVDRLLDELADALEKDKKK